MSLFLSEANRPPVDASPLVRLHFIESEFRQRSELSEQALSEGFRHTKSLTDTNRRLTELGREELLITELADIDPVYGDPFSIVKLSNNFVPGFKVFKTKNDSDYTPEKGMGDAEPVTEDELLQLQHMPAARSFSDFKNIADSGYYPALSMFYMNHTSKPAFHRMMAILPRFTIDLVLGMSSLRDRDHPDRYRGALYVAGQIMPRLTAVSDIGVQREDGSLNKGYLEA